jgi:hypothetical protein
MKRILSSVGFVIGVAVVTPVAGSPLKELPLPGLDEAQVSFGGQIRQRYENFNNPLWGAGAQDSDGHWLQRYMLNADFRFNETVRALVELKSGLVHDRVGGPRPTDEDELDLHQAFADARWGFAADRTFTLRVGRQELAYGSSRLVSFREGPNVRLSFDAVRARAEWPAWSADAFVAAPVETNPGIFDDGYERGQRLWGVYAVVPNPWFVGGKLDLYYLGFRQTDASFNQGPGREERHSLGIRRWGGREAWDYNFELVYQLGAYGAGRISAWTVASDIGHTWEDFPLKPRLGFKANITSGDRDPLAADLQTFNPLFPRGAYFSESGLIGPANLIDLHPSLDLHPHATITLTVDVDFFWRASTVDGLYGPAVNLVRSGQASDARYIGSQAALKAEWSPTGHWKVNVVYSRFFAGDFIRESGPGDDVDYASVSVTCLF